MTKLSDVPTWALVVAALASAIIFATRHALLMSTRGQRLGYVAAAIGGAAVMGVIALAKHNSANHALLIYCDAMIAAVLGSLFAGEGLREAAKTAAQAGISLSEAAARPATKKAANIYAWSTILLVILLIVGEYVLLR